MSENAHFSADARAKSLDSGTEQLLIDAKDAAAMLAIGARTLWTYTNCNAIPSRKIGRAVRYCPDELRAWIGAGCPTSPGSADRVRKEARR
tara:strand:+ start:1560 stop:1832 length:273 start_codon:yes stop_codon:yes gene_type:complete